MMRKSPFIKDHATTFDELFLTEDQQKLVQTFTGQQSHNNTIDAGF